MGRKKRVRKIKTFASQEGRKQKGRSRRRRKKEAEEKEEKENFAERIKKKKLEKRR